MTEEEYDVVVIGAGFSGLYALYKLGGLSLRLKGFETGDGPGGTWYWNRYPGARVDIESMIYSYSFDPALEQEWHWPEHFSPQSDLEVYANHVADRFATRDQIQFGATVNRLRFDDATSRWHPPDRLPADRQLQHPVAQPAGRPGLRAGLEAELPQVPGDDEEHRLGRRADGPAT